MPSKFLKSNIENRQKSIRTSRENNITTKNEVNHPYLNNQESSNVLGKRNILMNLTARSLSVPKKSNSEEEAHEK